MSRHCQHHPEAHPLTKCAPSGGLIEPLILLLCNSERHCQVWEADKRSEVFRKEQLEEGLQEDLCMDDDLIRLQAPRVLRAGLKFKLIIYYSPWCDFWLVHISCLSLNEKLKGFCFHSQRHPFYHPLFYRDILVPYNVSTGYFIYNIWVGGNLKIVNQPAAGENLPSVISETPTQYCESWFQSWVISTQFVICHCIWTLKRKKR